MIDVNKYHTRPVIMTAFAISVALGALNALHRHDTEAVASIRQAPIATPETTSPDPAAQSVQAMPAYKQACAERACGHVKQALTILANLAQSPDLDPAERAFCRQAMQ